MQMSLVSMRFIQFHVVLVQGRQKNVPKKNTIRGKFIVLLIKLSYCSCFDVLVAVVILVAKAPYVHRCV